MLNLKTIKWSDFFEHTEKQIISYKITPDKTVSNLSTPSLARAFHELYSSPQDRIKIDFKGVQVTYIIKDKVYFDIIFKPEQAYFYVSVPVRWASFVKTKMENIWPQCAIEETDKVELADFDISKCCVYDMKLTKANIFSLQTSHNDLYPLTSMMSVLNDMQGDDKVRVSYVFDPVNRLDWQERASQDMKKFREGTMPKRMAMSKDDIIQGGFNLANTLIQFYIDIRLLIIESLFFFMYEKEDRLEKFLEKKKEYDLDFMKFNSLGDVSDATTRKLTAATFKTFIRILSQSDDSKRRLINMRTVANSFKDLTGDNELQSVALPPKKQKKRFNEVLKFKPSWVIDKDILSDEEVSKLIQLPQITLQEQYHINSIDTRETDVPPELQDGIVPIGTAEQKGKTIKVTWSKDINIRALPKIVVGPQNAGKTTFTTCFAVGTYKAGDANIVLDYIQDCELSKAIERHIPSKDVAVIDVSDQNKLFALAYTEASKQITEQSEPWDRLKVANLLSGQIEYLINSITNDTTGELTAPMLRYLYAASMVVFIHPGKTIDDVFQVLRKWQTRNEYTRLAKYSGCFAEDDEIFFDLDELHERDAKGKIVGTRESLIIGILNRITALNKNIYLKAMLKAAPSNDMDFIRYIDEGKTVLIHIPQTVFPDPQVRDTLATYFMGRIWLAVQLREQNNNRLCHLIIDEVHHIPTCASFIKEHITEFRRHRLGTLFTVHYLKQFRTLLDAVKSAGASYMLLAGTEKDNLRALEEEIKPFTVEEGLLLKPYHSLNIINYGNQYARFISKLPTPLR